MNEFKLGQLVRVRPDATDWNSRRWLRLTLGGLGAIYNISADATHVQLDPGSGAIPVADLELVGRVEHRSPWRSDGSSIFDANGGEVARVVSPELAACMVEAMNDQAQARASAAAGLATLEAIVGSLPADEPELPDTTMVDHGALISSDDFCEEPTPHDLVIGTPSEIFDDTDIPIETNEQLCRALSVFAAEAAKENTAYAETMLRAAMRLSMVEIWAKRVVDWHPQHAAQTLTELLHAVELELTCEHELGLERTERDRKIALGMLDQLRLRMIIVTREELAENIAILTRIVQDEDLDWLVRTVELHGLADLNQNADECRPRAKDGSW